MSAPSDLTGQTVGGWSVIAKAPAQARVRFWTCTHEPCGIVVDLPHVTLTKAIAGKGGLPACTTCVPADERRNIDHGLHLACGDPHLLGTACPDGVQREPGGTFHPNSEDFLASLAPKTAASPGAAPTRAESQTPVQTLPASTPVETWTLGDDGLEERAAEIQAGVKATSALYYGHPSEKVAPVAHQHQAETCGRHHRETAPLANGGEGEFCCACSWAAQDYVWPCGEVVEPEPAAQLADAATGALVVHGRVDRLEAPQDVLDVIRRAMHGQERNHQSEPGPSQMGGCERRLGYHLATGEGNGRQDDSAWRPQVGTAVHAWLDRVFMDEDLAICEPQRWLVSHRVTNPVAGTIDIADLERRTAIDFKITGKTTRDKAARGEVSDKYEVQLDLYALGLINDGYPIERVALLLLPASGSLSEAVWYERPVDLDRAREAVNRRDRIKAMLSVAPIERVLPVLSTQDDYCGSCPALGKHCEGAAIAPAAPALRMVGGAA